MATEAGDGVTGRVRDLHPRGRVNWFTKAEEMELTFRVAVFDDLGNVERLVPVQISGSSFDGAIHENDEVQVEGRYKGGTLRARRIRNLTDGSELTASGLPLLAKIVAVVFFIGIAGFILFVGYQLVTA
jgi:hypothetical protein